MPRNVCPILVLALAFAGTGSSEEVICRGKACEWWVERPRDSRCSITLVARAVEYIAKEMSDGDRGKKPQQ